MLKKLCVTGIVVAAAGATLMSAPASADTYTRNSSHNHEASQSGNNFGNVFAGNVGTRRATNVNNINGNAATATNGSGVGIRVWVD
ncbi:hypothetical protein ACFXJ8_40895 [Nonomuraea sp. NPDC059194]|uniref:hypothetical protein n=1 Tax=Nonomuraea sp. NPDC059194 TaxID=3346764 RepID=UPI0036AEB397